MITSEQDAIKRIKNCLNSLQRIPDDIKTEKVCFAAVRQDGRALRFVPESAKTERLCLAAAVLLWSSKKRICASIRPGPYENKRTLHDCCSE